MYSAALSVCYSKPITIIIISIGIDPRKDLLENFPMIESKIRLRLVYLVATFNDVYS